MPVPVIYLCIAPSPTLPHFRHHSHVLNDEVILAQILK